MLNEDNMQLVIVNYSSPAIEGTIAVFSCNGFGYVFTGPSIATCMVNGEWAPDPREVHCEGTKVQLLG